MDPDKKDRASTRAGIESSSAGRFLFNIVLSACLFVLLPPPEPAWAIQSHPAPEGLYVHQVAHIIFIIGLAFLVYWLQINLFAQQRGWRYIQMSAVLFILWNVVAFAGHWVEEHVPRSLFVGDPDWSQRLIVGTNVWVDAFYILKFDHVVCVPAIVCLFIGVRALYHDVLRQGPASNE
ncbi:MAG: hypothetical protein LDL33_11425 [Desulfomonile sp.]|nr:hypothetical protein [Desulfomonile sp.]